MTVESGIDTPFCDLIIRKKSKFMILVDEGMYLLCFIIFYVDYAKSFQIIFNFEVLVKKIQINYKIYLQTSNYFIYKS